MGQNKASPRKSDIPSAVYRRKTFQEECTHFEPEICGEKFDFWPQAKRKPNQNYIN